MTGHVQKIMEGLLSPMGIKPFQDDNALASRSTLDHKKEVLSMLEAITYKAGLRLNLKKCKFFAKEARILGSIVSSDGIRMDPDKVKAICNWLRPVDGKAMQRFLGASNFNRDFSHKYAEIAAPLEETRNVKGPITWTDTRIKAFEELKKLFASNLMLMTIDWSKKMYLTTDASLVGIGAWIGQQNEEGTIMPIVCASKKLSPTQQRWSATKRELYSLMWAMQKLRHYLLGRNFIARVDHKPLVSMLRNKMNLMMEGWVDTILQFDFTPQYIPGEDNALADALSRSNEEFIKGIEVIQNPRDVELELEAKRRGKSIPDIQNRIGIIEKCHALGHFSTESVVKDLWKNGHWWPGMREDIRRKISECIDCQRFDTVREGFHPLKSIEADNPWDHIQIDLIGPLPISADGFQYILTVVDVMTGFTILRCLKNKTESDTARSLWSIICDFGVPKIIQSDNGAEFVNGVIKELTNLYGIDHRLITPYNPRSDGLVERKNKEVSRGLKKQMKSSTDRWEEHLSFIQLSLNYKVLERVGSRPFELFFGRPFTQFEDFSKVPTSDIGDSIKKRLDTLTKLKDVVLPSIASRTSIKRNKRNAKFDQSEKILMPIVAGTTVMIKDVTRASKWDPVYEGPFIVSRQTRAGNYVLKDVNDRDLPFRFSVNQLKLVDSTLSGGRKSSDSEQFDGNTLDNQSADEHYEILGILDDRLNKKKKGYDYLVRWKGYNSSSDSWVHEQDFDGTTLIKKYWKQKRTGEITLPRNRKSKAGSKN
jgi:hypothetical protein